jgi:hypothetical protein
MSKDLTNLRKLLLRVGILWRVMRGRLWVLAALRARLLEALLALVPDDATLLKHCDAALVILH